MEKVHTVVPMDFKKNLDLLCEICYTESKANFCEIGTTAVGSYIIKESIMNKKILKLLENNARMSNEDIAAVTGLSEQETAACIADMETKGVIRGYKGIVDPEKAEDSSVSAIIELKVIPKAGLGFEAIASHIAQYPNVESVFLMSGACDLCVIVKCKSFHDVSSFVAKELAIIDGVTSTATQFIMRRYKDFGVELISEDEDGRGNVSL